GSTQRVPRLARGKAGHMFVLRAHDEIGRVHRGHLAMQRIQQSGAYIAAVVACLRFGLPAALLDQQREKVDPRSEQSTPKRFGQCAGCALRRLVEVLEVSTEVEDEKLA